MVKKSLWIFFLSQSEEMISCCKLNHFLWNKQHHHRVCSYHNGLGYNFQSEFQKIGLNHTISFLKCQSYQNLLVFCHWGKRGRGWWNGSFLNPDWKLYKVLFWSKKLSTWSYTILSINFDINSKREMGLKFSGLV